MLEIPIEEFEKLISEMFMAGFNYGSAFPDYHKHNRYEKYQKQVVKGTIKDIKKKYAKK